MILMIDNYDSFTYNLVHYLEAITQEVVVARNDQITMCDIKNLEPKCIVLSPGPKTPEQAGITLSVIEYFKGKIPILGICLGHQAIAAYYGATIVECPVPVHGKVHKISNDGRGVFIGLPKIINVTRYHSLMVSIEHLPKCLEVSAVTKEGIIMGIRHKTHKVEGVQFHPEALLSEYGKQMLENFIKQCGDR